jgi:hypothetical protein
MMRPWSPSTPGRRRIEGAEPRSNCARGLRPRAGVLAHSLSRGSGPTLTPLVEPYPAPGLHTSSLYRSAGHFQPEIERIVVRVSKESVGLALQGAEMGGYVCEVLGHVLDGIAVVSWSGLRVLTHDVRIRTSLAFPRDTSERSMGGTYTLCRGLRPFSLREDVCGAPARVSY